MIVHSVRRGQFLRTLRPPADAGVPPQISELQVGMEGHVVIQTAAEDGAHRKVNVCRSRRAPLMQLTDR